MKEKWLYNWPLNNVGLNYTGPLSYDFFFLTSAYYTQSIILPVIAVSWIDGYKIMDMRGLAMDFLRV